MKVSLVTGGAGFVGSNLCEKLLERNHRVICLDNLSTGLKKSVESCFGNRNFSFVEADVRSELALEEVFRRVKINYIFHYAAVVGVRRTLEHPIEVLGDIEGTRAVLNLARKYDVEKVIYASSSEVYGHPVEIPEREDGHVNAKLPYAVTKLMSEKYMEAYHQIYGVRTTSLRFFNIYGPRQDASAYGFVVGIFIRQALGKKKLTIYGDGTQTRDFTYIEDNIAATLAALASKKADGEIVNIGTGKPTTIYDLASTIIDLTGNGKTLSIKYLPQRRNEIRHRFPDITKMKKILRYTPSFSLNEGLRKTIEWYRNKGKV
jgi:UDP-glucose 4-epimerase